MMAQNFPKDAFDSVTDVGGRHRAKRTVGSRFVSFSRYAGVAAVLSAAAVVALNLSSDNSIFSGNVGAKNSTQSQSFNSGGVGVTVIDATEQKGLATKVAQSLYDAGWNVLTATNLNAPGATVVQPGLNFDGTPRVPAATVPETTIVYASNATAQSAAQSVLKTLGNYKVVVSATYADPVTIVLGSDFK
jgi:hypothetical protein